MESERLGKGYLAKSYSHIVRSIRFWVSSWDTDFTDFHGFTFKRGGAEGRRGKRGMMLPSPSTSNFDIPCSIFDILSLRSRCPVLALGQALHIKKRPGTMPGLWCVFSFWLNQPNYSLTARAYCCAPSAGIVNGLGASTSCHGPFTVAAA
jgi:hypothetical protein